MFGNLFDSEPGSSSSFLNPGDGSTYLTCQVPPLARPACGLCGLQNQGATCYLNTLIQTLLYTPEFRESILNVPLSELQGSPSSELAPLSSQQSIERSAQVKERVIPLQLQRLFTRLLLLNCDVVSTADLTHSFGWKEQEELHQQQDVQELHRILFAALERSLVGTSGSQIVGQLYRGTLLNEVQCLQCKNVSKSLEDFLDLTLIVSKEVPSLEKSLGCSFQECENMKGNNQYFCSHCKMSVDAQKSSKIKFLPPILTFSLLRFNYDFMKGRRYKETGDFSFPMELDMEPFCSQPQANTHYELFSVIIHSGSTYGGHYHAYIKDIECLGLWSPLPSTDLTNDEKSPTENDPADQLSDPAFLLATILALQPNKGMLIETLRSELKNHSGSSWNSRFKSSHGPIVKFLLKNDDIFLVNNDANYVSLINGLSSGTKTATLLNSLPKDSSHLLHSSGHWFDFDDSQVRPIRVEKIPKQFGGTESAYMLCYRSSSLVRPPQAMGNIVHGVPDHLMCMVVEENAQLLQERTEYENNMNHILVSILFGVYHQQSQGVLQASGDSPSIQLPVDKRKSLGHLRELVFASSANLCNGKNFKLHSTLHVPAGIHLLQELTCDQNERSLIDLNIKNGDQVFVSYGTQILGVPVGEENIPILLCFSYHLADNSNQELQWAFPKSITVAEMKLCLVSLIPVLQLPLRICPFLTKGFSGVEAGFPDESSLDHLKMCDGDKLLVWEAYMDTQCIRVEIFNRTSQESRSTLDTECPSKSFTVEKNIDLLCVKAEALLKHGIPLDRSTELRFRKLSISEESWRQPPLHENQKLGEVFPEHLFCSLLLEEGIPPAPNEITLYWSIGVGSSPQYNANFNLGSSIEECLERICTLSGVQGLGKRWHLTMSNWLGEPVKNRGPCGDTLEGLQHGDLLYLEEGPPAPLAFLSLQVRLYPTPECLPSSTVASSAASMASQCREIETLLREQWSQCSQLFLPMGQVELSVNCTLAELKKQILTLPPLCNLHVSSVLHLRLRLWQKKSMTKTLRVHSSPLGRLKLCNQQVLCAELLVHEEDLMTNDIPLNVIHRIPGKVHFSSPVQFVWSAGKKALSKGLLTALADALHLNPRRLAIAKFFPKENRWELIAVGEGYPNDFQLKQQVRKGKMNLRQAPILLTEGDTIAVKDMALETDKLDNFWPEAQVDKQEELPQAKEQPRFILEDKEITEVDAVIKQSTEDHPRQPEVGISIHVDDFS